MPSRPTQRPSAPARDPQRNLPSASAEISLLLTYEVTRDLALTTLGVDTPLCGMRAPILDGKKLAPISILRAGNGLLDGILEVIPSARVGFVGLYRDEETPSRSSTTARFRPS